MNLLGLIFGILIICACTFSLSMHKFLLSRPVEISCHNHLKAARKILNSYESEYYKSLRESAKKEETKPSASKTPTKQTKRKEKPLSLNRDCSRFNLWRLIEKGKDENPVLYEAAAKILRSLYQKPLFEGDIRFEYTLLDAILSAAKIQDNTPPPLEKLILQDRNVKRLYPLQSVYYRMLKGTKRTVGKGYPCLTDYFSIENKSSSSLCLRHASIEMLSALFNPKAGVLLHQEMKTTKHPLEKTRILEICTQSGLTNLQTDFLELLDLKTNRHRLSGKKILVEQEGDVTLRKQIFLPNV